MAKIKELWIDCPRKKVMQESYWRTLAACGVRTADVMIDSSAVEWSPQYTRDDVQRIAEMAITYDVELVVTGWPAPRKSVIKEMTEDLESCAALGIAGIGLDTEHLWRSSYLDGTYRSLRSAAEDLMTRLLRIRERHDVRIELTTHTGHSEATERATLTPHVDRLYLQVYTTRHDWRGQLVAFDSHLGPGRRQTDAIATIRRRCSWIADGSVELCIGQALWDQSWPKVQQAEALDLAHVSAVSAGIDQIRGWSSKWVIGSRASSVVSDWAFA